MAELFSIFEDKCILKTTALIFESQSGPLLWYVHCVYTKKTQILETNKDIHFKIKMSDRNFTQRVNDVMTSLSSDKEITVQQCYICGERCDCSLTYLVKQIVSRGWNPIARSG